VGIILQSEFHSTPINNQCLNFDINHGRAYIGPMARILYGVHGTGHGHAMRALTVARHYPQHDFLFVSHGHGAEILGREFQVKEFPNPETPVSGHEVDTIRAALSQIRIWARQPSLIRKISRLIETFKPDVALTDYEYLVPRACRKIGLPCLSFDHQHVVTMARHQLPPGQTLSYWGTHGAIRFLFTRADYYLATSFYRPPLRPGAPCKLVPPLLRDRILEFKPRIGNHVLAYHGYETFPGFFEFLQTIPRKVIVYGSHRNDRSGNLEFKLNSENGFLDDLAGCGYVVCGGGHTLISEALYLQKPLVVFPIRNAFEQFLNAHYVSLLGYGVGMSGLDASPDTALDFETNLDQYRNAVAKESFCGNTEIYDFLDRFIAGRKIPV
jgi:uncharacterized protein (TIGR00661 family)